MGRKKMKKIISNFEIIKFIDKKKTETRCFGLFYVTIK